MFDNVTQSSMKDSEIRNVRFPFRRTETRSEGDLGVLGDEGSRVNPSTDSDEDKFMFVSKDTTLRRSSVEESHPYENP